jgi:hypothetical protein
MSSPGSRTTSTTATKVIALLLILGGGAGIAIAFPAETVATGTEHLAFIASVVAIFACSIWAGVGLWKGTRKGYIASEVLFALQIPSFTFSGFAYQFYIGSLFGVSFSSTLASKLNLDFQLGSAVNFQLSSEIENFVLGVNLIAVAALIYLIRASRQKHQPGPAS